MPTLDTVRAAAERIAGRVHRTPTTPQTSLGDLAGVRLHLKAELLQRTGSFKVRGVLNTVLTLSDEERARGLVTMSAGNHGAALAYAARQAGTTAIIVMPGNANPGKVAATKAYGGEVVLADGPLGDALTEVRERTGRTLVHPFDDPRVIAGAGTVGLEILEDVPDADVVVVQAGGGGLLAGVSAVVKALRPQARVYGVEPEGADAVSLGLAKGEPVTLWPVSVADALCAPFTGHHVLPVVREHVDEVFRIPDGAILHGLRMVLERTKYAVEPAGATGVAALLGGFVPVEPGERVVAIATGGNVDSATLATLLTS
ncbi:MAG TPA: pyridoxal-phosphate dependent enzyme [Frankiaceae bacterium]|nr:pyridoxal-phosphate dependent enzyme [Frankiaceae bacterium]